MKIYTRTGDEGMTGLFGGPRVSKSSLRIKSYGGVDELNAVIGVVRSLLTETEFSRIDATLRELQNDLFVVGADLATPLESRVDIARIDARRSSVLEKQIDLMEADLPELKRFILPAGSAAAANLHVARTVCRRAERTVVELGTLEAINPECVTFLNRASDFLFVAARWVNVKSGVSDEPWIPESE